MAIVAILRLERWAIPFAQRDRSFPLYLVTILSERALDFTLRSRYKTISISFAKGPLLAPKISSIFSPDSAFSTDHFISPPPPLPPFPSSVPFSRLARRISLQSSRADWHACCSITRSIRVRADFAFPPFAPPKERQYPRSYYYCPQFHPPLCFRYYSMECLVGRTLSDFGSWLTRSRGGEFFCTEF